MANAKTYVVADYSKESKAMYESNDFRLEPTTKVEQGIFKRDKSVKGSFNGREIGTFTTNKNKVYLVFTDYSVRLKN